MNTDAIASVAPQQTVISFSGSTSMSYHVRYLSAIASRSAGLPQVIAYWLTSPWIAAHAASFIGSGIGKSGKPWARLIAPYWLAIRVISRITDSVKLLARFAVAARLDAACISVMAMSLVRKLHSRNHITFQSGPHEARNHIRDRACHHRWHHALETRQASSPLIRGPTSLHRSALARRVCM